jgi:hypothetical protein
VADLPEVQDAGHAWTPKNQAMPVVHRQEFSIDSIDSAVVAF